MKDYQEMGYQQAENIVDENAIVEISRDKMLGVISFEPAKNGGKSLTLEAVRQKIKKAGIVSGIDEKLIPEIIKNKTYHHKYVIARGTPPKDGKNGKVEFLFDVKDCTKNFLRPKENEDGSVDFKTLDIIQTVKKDQLLAEIIPHTLGEPGQNVLGKEIRQTKGKPARLPRGKNVYTSADDQSLFASIEGQLLYTMNKINVSETYVVEGDAGLATGDIDFSGNVLIKGNVGSDFLIKAGGNVEVLGFVEGATIVAGNNIVLRHGIQGMDKGKLVAGGNIIAKFIQNSTVEAKGCLYTEAIMHSKVEVDDSVIVEVNKGLIVGGSVQATNLISAKIIGSPMSTATHIQISMTLSLHHKHSTTQTALAEKRKQLSQLDKNIKFIHNKLARGEAIPQARLAKVKQMLSLKEQLNQEIQSLKAEYDSLNVLLRDYKEGTIKVANIIYPGVKVTMGSYLKYIRTEIKYARLFIEDKEIKVDTFQ